MKPFLLFLYLWSVPMFIHAQARDLDYYLDQAKRNSPLIHNNVNARKIISLDMQQVQSVISKPEIYLEGNIMLAPIVSHDAGSSGFEWATEGATDYYGYDLALTDGGQYQAGIAIRKPLFAGSILEPYAQKADISRKINDNQKALTVHEIEQLVGYQYILCLKARAEAAYSKLMVTHMNEQLDIMKKLVDQAVYKQTDWMLMQIERTNFEEAYRKSRSDYRDNIYDLNLICGIRDTTVSDIVETDFQLHPAPAGVSEFIKSFRLDSLNLMAEQSIFEQKYKPRLYWFADAGLNASYLPTPDRLGFSTGLTFNWTIFDGRQRRIRQQITNINLNTIEFNRMDFSRKSAMRLNKLLRAIQAISERETLANAQLAQYDRLIDVYLSELPVGETSIMDLKNLIRDRTAKQQQAVDLKMERFVLVNSYNYWNY
jgi:outer membrane protein TolC